MALPSELTRADSLDFTVSLSLPTWATSAARVSLVWNWPGRDPVSVAATLSGTTAAVSMSAADTAQLDPGEWRVLSVVEEDGKRETAVVKDRFQVKPNPLEAEEESFTQRMVNALKASIEGRVDERGGRMLESHTINGQAISKMPLAEQQKLLERYEARLRREVDRARIAAGGTSRRTLYPDFT